jgi:amino acid adenylation domain-containing protein
MTSPSLPIIKPKESFIPFPHDFVDSTLVERFEQAVEKFSDLTAIVNGDKKLLYGELNRSANRLAHAILARVGPGEAPVVFLLDDKTASVISILGILKAGKIYLGLESSRPVENLQKIFKDAGPALVITDNASLQIARQMAQSSVGILNLDLLEGGLPDQNPHIRLSTESKAVIFYTSGSTGEPKGAVHTHRSALHFAWIKNNAMKRGPGDHVPLTLSFSYGWSLDLVFGTLLSGATIHPCDLTKMSMGAFGDWLIQQHITIVPCPVSFFRQWLVSLSESAAKQFPDIRLLDAGGGKLIRQDLEGWRRHFDSGCLLNYYYGSTEAGLITIQKYDQDSDISDPIPPLGFPAPDYEISLVDDTGRVVGSGHEGELIIKSRYMISGYWHRPEATGAVLRQDPADPELQIFTAGDMGRWLPDGKLEFLGRKDNQVKIRGYRVETDEVLSALSSHLGVKDAYVAALPVPHALEEKRLIAFVVPNPGMNLTGMELRTFLAARLPDFMIPARFVFLDKFPLNVNSKVDARALPEPARESEADFVAPRNPIEEELVKIWTVGFRFEGIGVQDDFLELGGDSLLAAQILTVIENRFNRNLPLALLAECRTIEQMARYIEHSNDKLASSLILFQSRGSRPPLFLFPGQHGDSFYFRNLSRRLGNDRPIYGIELVLSGTRTVPSIHLEQTAAGCLGEIQELQPVGPYFLAGHSFGGMLAFEIAQQLARSGQAVAFLGLFDTFAPGSYPHAEIPERVNIHRQNMSHLSWGERLKYGRGRVKALAGRILSSSSLLYFAERLKILPKDISWINQTAYSRYNPVRFPGKVTLFRVNDRPSYVRSDLTAGWKDYVAELETLDVPGTHGNMLDEPQIGQLAFEMKKCIEAA